MKIAIFLPRYHTNYTGVIQSLKNKRHQVKLYVHNTGYTENYSVIQPIHIEENILTKIINYFFNVKLNKFYLPNFDNFKKVIFKDPPDIIIMRSYNKLFMLYLLYLKLFNNFQFILYHQTDNHNLTKFNFSLKFIKFYFIIKIFKIKIYSPIISLKKKLYFKKIFFVPFVFKVSFGKRKIEKSNHFLIIGKFVKKKNHEMFVRAIKYLDDIYNIKATIIGEVSTKEHRKEFTRIKNLISRLGLKNKIKLLKNIKNQNIEDHYKKNQFFVLPTSGDLAPITIIEALGNGCMVLCSSTCGTKIYIKKGFNGFVFKNNDQISMNYKMIKMIKSYKIFKKNYKKNNMIVSNSIGEKTFYKFFNRLIKI